ncbi:PREDICTED: UPF0725 protein At3g44770-like [Camelina sativa]|uniref:UPF0725 protein At3g44770-like n=1 Tax=Camelina sativa TaxID=90675 RepID=A0ABM1R0Y3_CAMSA|nr:PREDICTED: UPF0725 protein At3g44770-like [Camelina sativa]
MADTLRRMLESGELTETLRRMLENGKLTDEQCLSILQVLDSDGCTSEKVIEEKAVKRIDNRKSLKQLLAMRDPESDLLRRYEEESDSDEEESDPDYERYHRQLEESQFFDIDRDVRVPRWGFISPFYFGEKEEEQEPPPEMVLYGRLGVHWFNFEHNRNLKFIRIPKLNTGHPYSTSYYLTIDVEDFFSPIWKL